ncbi:amidase [Piedraia hortae CBS 480.64]|uniref:amidase n=1 Tax=Piedraia hortae CBS 480.64 TaxID=1314780 RepID=A0A6A7BSP3_9PEZI|nr:amidase [Piedraia hortae CBS 480.64]
MASESQSEWSKLAAQAKEKRDGAIPVEWRLSSSQLPAGGTLDVTKFPQECGLLSEVELDITDSFATDILTAIKDVKWTSEQVVRAFCKRAAIAQQVTNCLTVIMFEEAIDQAKKLDEHLKKTGKTIGLLHGLPISLKDCMNVTGKPSSVGFSAWALVPMKSDAVLVSTLRELGAIPFVKTNLPMSMMCPDTVNNCYGRTVNPRNRELTPGGSSGGESALIAMHGSVLGVGTDIGGSVRIPASCTGIFALRPSHGRIPHSEERTPLAGLESVYSVAGPMGRSISDLQLFCSSVISTQPWLRDPKCLPIPWRKVDMPSKLKIGVLEHNGEVTPTPPVKYALDASVAALKRAGHEVRSWDASDYAEAVQILLKFFDADGGKGIKAAAEPVGEPLIPGIESYTLGSDRPTSEMWRLQMQRTELSKRMLDRWGDIDCILGPVSPYVAPKHGQFRSFAYTGVYNLLDYSSVSFPTGFVADRDRDIYPSDFKPCSKTDKQTWAEYDPNAVHGMGINLQLVGRQLEEEKVLNMTQQVLQALRM